jgi:hypothetical protein
MIGYTTIRGEEKTKPKLKAKEKRPKRNLKDHVCQARK